MAWVRAWSVVWALGLVACGSDEAGQGTGATCSDSRELLYEEHIAPLMDRYCNGCHGSDVAPSARHGAPSDHNFDSEAGLLAEAEHIDLTAAAGPDAVNTSMPPEGYPAPSLEEREVLGEWLACMAPEGGHDHDHDHDH